MVTNVTGLPQVVAGPTVGVEASSPPNITQHRIAPTITDYYNFNTGDLWLQSVPTNTTPVAGTLRAWMLAAKNVNAQNQKTATWIPFFNGAAGSLVSLTGNVGGPVFGDANQNVNTVGDGVGITVTGVPGTNTLTWSLVGGGQAIQALQPAINGVPNGAAVTPTAGVIQINNTDINIVPIAGVPNPNNLNLNFSPTIYVTNVANVGLTAPGNIASPSAIDNGAVNVYSSAVSGGKVYVFNSNVGTSSGLIGINKSRGTGAIQIGDSVGTFVTLGQGTTPGTYIPTMAITSQCTQSAGVSTIGGNMQFFTSNGAGTLVQRMVIQTDGSINIIGADQFSANPSLTVGNQGFGNVTLNLAVTYNVPPPGPTTDILIIDSNGNVGTGGVFVTGTFTPSLTFSTSTGTITYVSRGGKYTQIGNVVYFDATVAVSSIGTSTGTMRMSSFPVAIATLVNTAQNVAAQFSGAITLTAGYSDIYGSGIATTTSFTIDQEGSGVNSTTITDTNVTIGGGTPNFTLTLTGFYFSS